MGAEIARSTLLRDGPLTDAPAPPPASAAATTERTGRRASGAKTRRWLLAAVIFVGSFLLRLLDPGFFNDHFQTISQGRQILAYGELPFRDFLDPGFFLMPVASAAVQRLFGYNLLGEALLSIALLSAGATLTFLLAARASRSLLIALATAGLVVLAFPRLYSYPKIFLLVLGLLMCWRYVDRPSLRRLVPLALTTALAFLFRHDLGVYVGLAAAVMLVVTHWRDGYRLLLRRLAVYAGVAALPILPFLGFLQANGGIGEYFASGLEYARSEARRQPVLLLPGFTFDLSAPLLALEPPPQPSPVVEVRWARGVSAEQRAELERRYRLTSPEFVREEPGGARWRYALADVSRSNVGRLAANRNVDDTEGFDDAIAGEAFYVPWRRAIPLLRLSIAPGIVQAPNAVPWLYYLFVSLPAIALLVLLAGHLRPGWGAERLPGELPKILCAAVLCILADRALVREPIEYRWADAVAPTAVLGAWLLGRWLAPRRARAGAPGSAPALWRVAAALGLVGITALAVFAAADLGDQLERTELDHGLRAAERRLPKVLAELRTSPPIEHWAARDPIGKQAIARYVRDCTGPHDRLLLTWFAPDLYFYAERGFAAGQIFWYSEYGASPPDQEQTIERLRGQSVPIVIEEAQRDEKFEANFPLVNRYLLENYRVAGETDFGEDTLYRVLADKRRVPAGTYRPWPLPCYR